LPRRMILPAAIAATLATLVAPTWAHAQEVAAPARAGYGDDYDLQAGSVPATLDAIAARSGRQIVFDRQAMSGLVAEAVRGHLSPVAAVTQALTSTGYVVEENAAGVLTVRRAAQVQRLLGQRLGFRLRLQRRRVGLQRAQR
ncbi:conserved hypothetical protein, partial [Ricinus communis]